MPQHELQVVVNDINAVPEAVRPYYLDQGNNTWRLQASGIENLDNLKKALEIHKTRSKDAAEKLEAVKEVLGGLDIEALRQLGNAARSATQANATDDSGHVSEELIEARTIAKEAKEALDALQTNYDSLLDTHLKGQALQEVALAGVRPEVAELVASNINSITNYVDGKVQLTDGKGGPLLDSEGLPVSAKGYLETLRAESPCLFAANTGGGKAGDSNGMISRPVAGAEKLTAIQLLAQGRDHAQ